MDMGFELFTTEKMKFCIRDFSFCTVCGKKWQKIPRNDQLRELEKLDKIFLVLIN